MNRILELETSIKKLNEERAKIFEKIDPLQKAARAIYEQINVLSEKLVKEKLQQDLSEQEQFDLIMEENGFTTNQIQYNEANKFIQSLGLFMSGYCIFSQQKMSDAFIYKKDSERNKKTIEGIKKLFDLYKPMDEDGNKRIRVFCQPFNILVNSNGQIFLESSRDKKQFNDFEDLFEHYINFHTCYDDEENDED